MTVDNDDVKYWEVSVSDGQQTVPLTCNRQHLSNNDCLKDKKQYIRTVLYCCILCMTLVHNDTYIHHAREQFLKLSVGLGWALVFVRLFRFSFLRNLRFNLDDFVLVLFACFCCVIGLLLHRLAVKNVSEMYVFCYHISGEIKLSVTGAILWRVWDVKP